METLEESDHSPHHEIDDNFGGEEWEVCKEIRETRHKPTYHHPTIYHHHHLFLYLTYHYLYLSTYLSIYRSI